MTTQVTPSSLIDDLHSIGIREGDTLGLGLSIRSLGIADAPIESLITALQTVIGTKGTIMIPAYTSVFSMSEMALGLGEIFDPEITHSCTGAASEFIRKHPDGKRSTHPSTSIAAIGALATELTQNHTPETPAYSPYSALADVGGKILCIGIGDNLVGIRHEAQYQAGLLSVVPFKHGNRYRDESQKIHVVKRTDTGGCVTRLPELVTDLRNQGHITDGKIGNAKSIFVPARIALESMANTLRSDPTRNLCTDMKCLWCREIERRLNLTSRIEQPHLYQRNRVANCLLAMYNYFRLSDYSLVTKAKQIKRNM